MELTQEQKEWVRHRLALFPKGRQPSRQASIRKIATTLNMKECCIPMSEFEVFYLIKEGIKHGYEPYEVLNAVYWFVREGYLEIGYSRGVRLRDVLSRFAYEAKEEEEKLKVGKPKGVGKEITVRAHDEHLRDGRVVHHQEYTYYR